jgi:hypothetical protein
MLTWLPITLRRPFLVLLALILLLLAVILTVLCWYPAKHHGLGKDDGSLGLLVGWRYVPTLIAVLFTQALVMVAEDVKRTEAFARMAQSQPVKVQHTLLYTPRVWWKSVFEGSSRKRREKRRPQEVVTRLFVAHCRDQHSCCIHFLVLCARCKRGGV